MAFFPLEHLDSSKKTAGDSAFPTFHLREQGQWQRQGMTASISTHKLALRYFNSYVFEDWHTNHTTCSVNCSHWSFGAMFKTK